MRDTNEHAPSYYAATRNYSKDYPTLRGEQHADVVVVGGGFTGVSAALHLVERGYSVALIEENRIGWGASGRNGGQLIDGFVEVDKIESRYGAGAADIARQMGLECRDIVVELIKKHSIDCDLKFGYLDLALCQSDIDYFHETVEEKQRTSYPHECRFVPKTELRDYVGSDIYSGGLVNSGNGHLHPLNLCIGEARAAAELGVRIFEQSRVTRIQHGEKPVIETAQGKITATNIVLAGNAYLGRLEPKLRGAAIPAGSYVIATEPLSDAVATELLPRDMACCDQRSVLDYFRLSSDKRMLFGGFCNYSGRDPKDIGASLGPKMHKVFPQLKNARIDFEWGGNIAISVNRIPQLGRIHGNTYYAQGYSGHGVAPTHLAGKVLADIIAGDSEQFDVFSKVRHLRLPGGKFFANPALALGMMYYRLKDLL